MTKYILLILIILKLSTTSIACRSLDYKSFSQLINQSELVALVKIVKISDEMLGDQYSQDIAPKYMDLKILYLYKGQEKEKIIRVLGGWDTDCKVNLTRLKNEKYLLTALTKSSDKLNNEYFLYDTGEYFVRVTIWMYCFYSALTITSLYLIYRIIKKFKKRGSAYT